MNQRSSTARRRGAFFACAAAAAAAAASAALHPLAAQIRSIALPNADFEEGEAGAPPPGWTDNVRSAAAPAYRIVVDDADRRSGRASVRIEHVAAEISPQQFGTITGSLDATPYRGRRVRLTAAVRADAPDARHAGLWLRVDRPERRRGFFDNMADRPIRSAEWRDYAVEGDVAADAEQLFFGALLAGAGRLWADDFRLDDIGPATSSGAARISPLAYLDQALALLREHHINSGSADWDGLTAEARASAAGATTPSDTYAAILRVIAALGERHTFFRPPPTPGQPRTLPPPVTMPSWELVDGRFGVVRLPGFLGSQAEADRYIATLREGLMEMDRRGVCGWVVDLREDTGGNMWPMLAGLDPLLGTAPFGSFRSPSGRQTFWIRGNGDIRPGPAATAQPPAFSLRRAGAPVAVLLGPRTGSSGEMTAISFVGRPNARSFGAATAGFTTANAPYPLADGAQLVITTAYVRDRTGHEYREAMTPDEPTEPDAALPAALRWLAAQRCG